MEEGSRSAQQQKMHLLLFHPGLSPDRRVDANRGGFYVLCKRGGSQGAAKVHMCDHRVRRKYTCHTEPD